MRSPITLEADMPVVDVLLRLARYGLWSASPMHPRIADWLASWVSIGTDDDETAREPLVARPRGDPERYAAAIRRQVGAGVFWYTASIAEVLRCCASEDDATRLWDALTLNASASGEPHRLGVHDGDDEARLTFDGYRPTGIVLSTTATSVSPARSNPESPQTTRRTGRQRITAERYRGPQDPALDDDARSAETVEEIRAWPKVEAPEYVPAGAAFSVSVGLSDLPQGDTAGIPVRVGMRCAQAFVDLDVELSIVGVEAPNGWTRVLRVGHDAPASATVRFTLTASEPHEPDGYTLTMLEVRYLRDSVVCGFAAKPLIIGPRGVLSVPARERKDQDWRDQARVATEITAVDDPFPPDLTIEITKPNRNAADGRYVCILRSPHAVSLPRTPLPIDLGHDARTFAKELVEQVQLYRGSRLLDLQLRAVGAKVSRRLPTEVFDALRAVQHCNGGGPPDVLLVSDEPFVPWELAWIEKPLDVSRPSFLAAQTRFGRWLRPTTGYGDSRDILNPPVHPPSALTVDHLAVMSAKYLRGAGLSALPMAEAEAKTLSECHRGIVLQARAADFADFLNAEVKIDGRIVDIGALHFAGHGEFDAARGESGLLYLSDGTALGCSLFEAARYGGAKSPLIFFNACMSGVGGDILGESGGFPANCLRGGFGAMIGALWEVEDAVAHDFALEFWRRALPVDGAAPEAIGPILADLRSRHGPGVDNATCLAYTYYGHPRLALVRGLARGEVSEPE